MVYLLPTEYEQYGLSAEMTDDWVATASALMESFCHRPTLMASNYTERLRLMAGSVSVRLSYLPLVSAAGEASPLISVRARLGGPRRGEVQDAFLHGVALAYGAAGSWTTLDPSSIDVDLATGELTPAGNLFGFSYNELEVTYTSGVLTVPPQLKVACAQIVRNAQSTPGLNVRSTKVDTLTMQYFSGSLLDDQVKGLLQQYVGRRVG